MEKRRERKERSNNNNAVSKDTAEQRAERGEREHCERKKPGSSGEESGCLVIAVELSRIFSRLSAWRGGSGSFKFAVHQPPGL